MNLSINKSLLNPLFLALLIGFLGQNKQTALFGLLILTYRLDFFGHLKPIEFQCSYCSGIDRECNYKLVAHLEHILNCLLEHQFGQSLGPMLGLDDEPADDRHSLARVLTPDIVVDDPHFWEQMLGEDLQADGRDAGGNSVIEHVYLSQCYGTLLSQVVQVPFSCSSLCLFSTFPNSDLEQNSIFYSVQYPYFIIGDYLQRLLMKLIRWPMFCSVSGVRFNSEWIIKLVFLLKFYQLQWYFNHQKSRRPKKIDSSQAENKVVMLLRHILSRIRVCKSPNFHAAISNLKICSSLFLLPQPSRTQPALQCGTDSTLSTSCFYCNTNNQSCCVLCTPSRWGSRFRLRGKSTGAVLLRHRKYDGFRQRGACVLRQLINSRPQVAFLNQFLCNIKIWYEFKLKIIIDLICRVVNFQFSAANLLRQCKKKIRQSFLPEFCSNCHTVTLSVNSLKIFKSIDQFRSLDSF